MTHTSELSLILESFDRNARVNRVVLDAISVTEWAISDERGGRTIGLLLGELADFRKGWLEGISPPHAEDLEFVTVGDDPDWRLEIATKDELIAAFQRGDAAARQAVLDAVEEGRSFSRAYESHPAHFLQHILVHDAHHRGQVMTLMRQGGWSAEDLDALERDTWPIWRE